MREDWSRHHRPRLALLQRRWADGPDWKGCEHGSLKIQFDRCLARTAEALYVQLDRSSKPAAGGRATRRQNVNATWRPGA